MCLVVFGLELAFGWPRDSLRQGHSQSKIRVSVVKVRYTFWIKYKNKSNDQG